MSRPQPTGGFEWVQAPWGAALRCRPLAAVAEHLFTARDLELQDDQAEWRQVAESLGVTPERLLLVRQVHGADAAVARQGTAGGWPRPDADVIVTDDPAAAIAVRVADCAPILMADRRRPAVAAVHAGWRGAVASAARAGVEALHREFGSEPRDLIAAIGPCLGAGCGEVGHEVVEAFRASGHPEGDIARWFSPGAPGKWQMDLALVNADQLAAAGLRPEDVHVAGLCTRTHAAILHSYRADGLRAGRMAGVIRPGVRR